MGALDCKDEGGWLRPAAACVSLFFDHVCIKSAKRYTSNSYYNKIIKFLNYKYPTYNIVIFSEGSIKDFNELKGKNLSFKLNKSIEETFHSLVSAKILVTAKSSFSYSAAILNSNEIYYINFWHKPLKSWKIISDLSL